MGLEVLGEFDDSLREQGDLYFRRTGIAIVSPEIGDRLCFHVGSLCQGYILLDLLVGAKR